MPVPIEALLAGSIDVHAHSYPEYTLSVPPRLSNLEWAEMAGRYGMRGFVMKSHVWPTATQTYDLRRMADGVAIFGSITLNHTVGGLNPAAVAIAGELGAKTVFMPTWSAANDMAKGGLMASRIRTIYPGLDGYLERVGGGISVVDAGGAVTPEAREVLAAAKPYGMCVASAHLSAEEGVRLAEAAADAGVAFTYTHPYNRTVGATVEQQIAAADAGAFVEHCLITCMPMHMRADIREIARAIERVGPERVIFSTDAIGAWNPPPPELMRMTAASLRQLGFDDREVFLMVRDNPAKLLNLEPYRVCELSQEDATQ